MLGLMRKSKLDPKLVVGLVRVSTSDQELGLEAQRAKLKVFCESQGLTLVQVFEERVSGAAPIEERTGLFAAMAEMKACHAGVLLFASRDRIARDALVAGLIGQAVQTLGGQLLTADGVGQGDDAAAQLIRSVLDAVAEFERHMIRARTKAAMAQKKARGEFTGGSAIRAPYGYQIAPDGKTLLLNPKEQAVISAARDMRRHGMSLRDIADNLELVGYRPRSGKEFHKTQVSRMLQSEGAVPVGHRGQDPEVHEGPNQDPVPGDLR